MYHRHYCESVTVHVKLKYRRHPLSLVTATFCRQIVSFGQAKAKFQHATTSLGSRQCKCHSKVDAYIARWDDMYSGCTYIPGDRERHVSRTHCGTIYKPYSVCQDASIRLRPSSGLEPLSHPGPRDPGYLRRMRQRHSPTTRHH